MQENGETLGETENSNNKQELNQAEKPVYKREDEGELNADEESDGEEGKGGEGDKKNKGGISFSVMKEQVPHDVDIHFENNELYLILSQCISSSSNPLFTLLWISSLTGYQDMFSQLAYWMA